MPLLDVLSGLTFSKMDSSEGITGTGNGNCKPSYNENVDSKADRGNNGSREGSGDSANFNKAVSGRRKFGENGFEEQVNVCLFVHN